MGLLHVKTSKRQITLVPPSFTNPTFSLTSLLYHIWLLPLRRCTHAPHVHVRSQLRGRGKTHSVSQEEPRVLLLHWSGDTDILVWSFLPSSSETPPDGPEAKSGDQVDDGLVGSTVRGRQPLEGGRHGHLGTARQACGVTSSHVYAYERTFSTAEDFGGQA